MKKHYITSELLNFEDIDQIFKENKKLELSDEAQVKLINAAIIWIHKMESHTEPIYGINTGFGALV